MRIACPACNAVYQVPDDQLRVGRVVRCARCGTDWAPVEADAGPDEPPAPAEAPSPPPEPEPAPPEPEPPRAMVAEEIPIPHPPVLPPEPPADRGPALLAAAWAVSVVAVVAALIGLYSGRDRVMQSWPPSIRAYAALGLGAPPASEGRE